MNDLMTKSFLSYVELKKQAQIDIEFEELDLEAGQLNPSEEPNLSQFFEDVNSIRAEMEDISNLLLELRALNEESKSTHGTKLLRGLRDRMESDVIAVLRKAMAVKARIESLDKSNVANRRISELYKEGSPVDRTRVLVTNGLTVKLREIMNEFQLLRETILSDYKDDLKRKYYAATGEEPSEEVMDKMVSGSGGVQMFRGNADAALKCQEKHDAVMDVQRSLRRLHQVFLDMAVLVDAQGEKLDDIEENVANARSFMAGGTNNLYYANQMKKKKCMFWVWAVIVMILVVCIIALLGT